MKWRWKAAAMAAVVVVALLVASVLDTGTTPAQPGDATITHAPTRAMDELIARASTRSEQPIPDDLRVPVPATSETVPLRGRVVEETGGRAVPGVGVAAYRCGTADDRLPAEVEYIGAGGVAIAAARHSPDAWLRSTRLIATAITDVEGRFELVGIPAALGACELVCVPKHDPHCEVSRFWQREEGEPTLILPNLVRTSGVLASPDGRGVDGVMAVVTLVEPVSGRSYPITVGDDASWSGWTAAAELVPIVSGEGGLINAWPLTLIDGGTAGSVVVCRKSPAFLVHDAVSKEPILDVEISLWSSDGRQRHACWHSHDARGFHRIPSPRVLATLDRVGLVPVFRAKAYRGFCWPGEWDPSEDLIVELARGRTASLSMKGGSDVGVRCLAIEARGALEAPIVGMGYPIAQDHPHGGLDGLVPGTYAVTATDSAGRPRRWVGVVVDEVEVDFEAIATGSLEVELADGLSAARHVVIADVARHALARIDEGLWRIDAVPIGTYRLAVVGPGGGVPVVDAMTGAPVDRVFLVRDEVKRIQLRAERPADVLEVVDEDGVPVEGALVRWPFGAATSDAGGRSHGWLLGDDGHIGVTYGGIERTLPWLRLEEVCRAVWHRDGREASIAVEIDSRPVTSEEASVFVVDAEGEWERARSVGQQWHFCAGRGPRRVVVDVASGDRWVFDQVAEGAGVRGRRPLVRPSKPVRLQLGAARDWSVAVGVDGGEGVWFSADLQLRLSGAGPHVIHVPETGRLVLEVDEWGGTRTHRMERDCSTLRAGELLVVPGLEAAPVSTGR